MVGMAVPMVNIRVMTMRMSQRFVLVLVGMRLIRVDAFGVSVLVMSVVHVTVRMDQGLMVVLVLVPLRQMQPHAHAHERAGRQQAWSDRFVQQGNRQRRTHEWREREVGARARRAQVP